jgi:hypothetical protein
VSVSWPFCRLAFWKSSDLEFQLHGNLKLSVSSLCVFFRHHFLEKQLRFASLVDFSGSQLDLEKQRNSNFMEKQPPFWSFSSLSVSLFISIVLVLTSFLCLLSSAST